MGRRGHRIGAAAAVALAMSVAAPATAWAGNGATARQPYEAGDPGVGDSYFPLHGNGGYDTRHYALDIRYQPQSDHLTGTTTVHATATSDLFRFNMDLVGLTVRSISVNGQQAQWERTKHELVITPKTRLRDGQDFAVKIRYEGVPKPFESPTLGKGGFLHTDNGALVVGQPQVAARWYPVNDHPQDKATYTVDITVPKGLEAISNGRLLTHRTGKDWTTWRWVTTEPMASYLATATIGQYEIRRSRTPDGLPVFTAVDPDVGGAADNALAKQTDVLDFLESQFGPYPFHAVGGLVHDSDLVGYALENQTRPIYSPGFFSKGKNPGEVYVVVHELAHQWYGDNVSVHQWDDLWLNEGFATYAEWLWSEHTRAESAQKIFDFLYVQPGDASFWAPQPGDPGAEQLFSSSVYTRGAMTLHALRMTVGDEKFFEIVRTWHEQQAGGDGSTKEFIALSEQISGRQLDKLFQSWLYTTDKPAYPGGRTAPTTARTTQQPPEAIQSLRHRMDHANRF